jgi:hypothetical protein
MLCIVGLYEWRVPLVELRQREIVTAWHQHHANSTGVGILIGASVIVGAAIGAAVGQAVRSHHRCSVCE